MRILVAIEDSEFGSESVDRCRDFLARFGSNDVHLVSAIERMVMPTEPFAVSDEYVELVDKESENKARETLEKAATTIRSRFPHLASGISTAVLIGSPAHAIVEEAERWNAHLIVLAPHGYGFWQRAVLGSVSNAVLHHAPCSVLILGSSGKAI